MVGSEEEEVGTVDKVVVTEEGEGEGEAVTDEGVPVIDQEVTMEGGADGELKDVIDESRVREVDGDDPSAAGDEKEVGSEEVLEVTEDMDGENREGGDVLEEKAAAGVHEEGDSMAEGGDVDGNVDVVMIPRDVDVPNMGVGVKDCDGGDDDDKNAAADCSTEGREEGDLDVGDTDELGDDDDDDDDDDIVDGVPSIEDISRDLLAEGQFPKKKEKKTHRLTTVTL
ncbi:unnamed protein product [Choristocarpus tenellus]